VGMVASPVWPICGYILHYSTGPERQWWAAPINALGIRYSFTLAGLIGLSLLMHWNKLRFGKLIFNQREKMLLAFLAVVWLMALLGPETVGRYTSAAVDHPSVKFTKIVIFVLMVTHAVTTLRRLDLLVWAMIVGGMILGAEAYGTPRRSFASGRLDSVGGPDFAESNFLAAYMAALLWIIGAKFLSSDWRGKTVCFLAGGFVANTIVLTRSRGAVVGLAAGGFAAIILAPKKYRARLVLGMLVAAAGFYSLTDDQFLARTSTIAAEEGERDSSAQSRFELARAGLRMWFDNPLGVGPGNFYQTIGRYIPEYAGKDAHNTYIRCLTELGIQGLILLGLLIVSGFLTLRRIQKRVESLPDPERQEMLMLSFGLTCALATLAACCLTISLTYVEFVWWILMLPTCLERATTNLEIDTYWARAALLDSGRAAAVPQPRYMVPQFGS
jgi:putative inorganic carbon (HCO3(-)) transporter